MIDVGLTAVIAVALALGAASAHSQSVPPVGEIQGSAWTRSPESLAQTIARADVVLPATATGGTIFSGKFKDIPPTRGAKMRVVLFLHGSSGLGLKAIGEWQQWPATLGYASVAPDSFASPGRVTYKSPIDKDAYERIHAFEADKPVL